MKRILAILCAVSLLLTLFAACDDVSTPSSVSTTAQTEASQTAVPTTRPAASTVPRISDDSAEDMDDDWIDTSEDLSIQTEPAVTEPAVTEPAATEPLIVGPVHVLTDYSAYSSYAGSGAKYTRLREGPLDHFEPSDDYGGVYPYKAAQLMWSFDSGYAGASVSKYGLVDRDGRVVTDGIYSNVQAMRKHSDTEDSYVYQPFWITEICDNPVVAQKLDYEGNPIDVTGVDDRYGVISMDGSFALPEDYVSVSAFTEGFCCYRSCLNDQGLRIYDMEYNDYAPYSSDFEVYDGRGKLCFTGKQVEGTEGKGCYLSYGEGLYLLNLDDDDEGSEYWFLDKAGRRVAGPFASASPFSDGLACVSTDGNLYGFIDKTGTLVIPEQYMSESDFRDGYALVRRMDGRVIMIDRTGNQLRQFDQIGLGYNALCGVRIWDFSVDYFYDLEGNLLAQEGENDWVQCLDRDTFYSNWGNSRRIFRASGEELILDELSDVVPFWTLWNGTPTSGYCAWVYTDDGMKALFIPHDLSAAYPMEIPDYVSNFYHDPHDFEDPVYRVYDGKTNELWYMTPDQDGWNAVRSDGVTLRIPLRAKKILLLGDRIMCRTDRASVMLDLEGNVIFCYPLDAED